MKSMRTRLLLILLLTTGAVWLSAAAWIYWSTQARVEQVLDARLREAARMVDSLITDHRIEIATAAGAIEGLEVETMTDEPYSHQLSCQIWSLAGTLVGRSEAAPRERLASNDDGFSQTTIKGETWRVYTVLNSDRGVQVMVGDNLQVRQSLVNDVMTGTLLPMTVVLPIAGLLTWLSVQRGMRPLDRMAGLLGQRHAADLRPVDLPDAPGELRPALDAINGLFGRVAGAREREKSFTAFAAHELKTPLAGLKTQAQIALASDDPEIRRHALEQIAGGVDRSSRLVRQLLDLAAVDANEERETISPADPGAIVRDSVQSVESLAARRGVTIDLEGAHARTVSCDRALATTALRNIVENAVLHSPAGGRVRIVIASSSQESRFEVIDAGPGMSDDDLAHARERFWRGASRDGVGSGLGLAIVDTIMRRVGGHLTLANEKRGGFRATLHFQKG
ncbi:sensor histidine kinase [Aliihoeflea sp. 40Bstr573]|uniref:sensor histidine kinase n=1 Tax=Aliihoeflea sp. 40Bstr573 TaxID=2696467 RepID=UPI002095D992|nr:sensor histidine kinase [Aliihoeflea sp. 40Bstr573]MCO6388513.1 two-component sensor histidine kinase [Aliihoeflea sp. 40Bstr573]